MSSETELLFAALSWPMVLSLIGAIIGEALR